METLETIETASRAARSLPVLFHIHLDSFYLTRLGCNEISRAAPFIFGGLSFGRHAKGKKRRLPSTALDKSSLRRQVHLAVSLALFNTDQFQKLYPFCTDLGVAPSRRGRLACLQRRPRAAKLSKMASFCPSHTVSTRHSRICPAPSSPRNALRQNTAVR